MRASSQRREPEVRRDEDVPTRHLSEEESRETVQRAREIAEQGREPAALEADYEVYLQAAEEVGVSREAVLQALRERLLVPSRAFAEGETVFAPSSDGFWYPAVLKSLGEQTAAVEFVSGGEHTCALADLRPLTLIPGRKLQADLKGWGWGDAIVERHDAGKRKVRVVHDDWFGTKETVPLTGVRLAREHAVPERRTERNPEQLARAALVRYGVLAGGAGVALGLLLAKLLPFL